MASSIPLSGVHRKRTSSMSGYAIHADNHAASARPSVLPYNDEQDAWELARVGKKQVLERRFGLASMIGFCCSIMTTWEGTIINFTFGLTNGGPAGLVYGFIICWIGTTSVFICMGELASMLPTAAGQYLWVSVLAPRKYSRFLSYVTGWVTVVAWLAAPTAAAYVIGSLIQNVVKLNISDYDAKPWHALLIMYAVLLLAMIMNNTLGTILPYVEIFILGVHLFGFLAMLIALTTIGTLGNPREIFTTFFNGGHWSTNAQAFFIGLFGNANAFTGVDGAIHMAEEIQGSSINTPRSMILAITINGALGFVMMIVYLLFAGNLQAILDLKSEFPFMNILQYALKSTAGATVLISVLIAMIVCAIVALMSSASRMMWSFAREQAMPGWSWLRLVSLLICRKAGFPTSSAIDCRKINRRTSIPTYPTYVIMVIAMLLGLINLGSTTTFNALISLELEGWFGSYLISLSLLLWRRTRGDIRDSREEDGTITTADQDPDSPGLRLTWGPWRLKGIAGILNNIFAIAYLVIIMFFGFWPPSSHTTPQNMNYSVLVLGAVSLGSMLYYFLVARKQYTGPKVEVAIRQQSI